MFGRAGSLVNELDWGRMVTPSNMDILMPGNHGSLSLPGIQEARVRPLVWLFGLVATRVLRVVSADTSFVHELVWLHCDLDAETHFS